MLKTPYIIYEDKDILAVNKPPGLLVHNTPKSENETTLVDLVIKEYPEIAGVGDRASSEQIKLERSGVVHRLDKDTSGIILIAKNQKSFENLKELFQKRAIKKTYRALVYGKISPRIGKIEKTISIKPGTTKRTIYKGKLGKGAVTRYRVLEYINGLSWIEVIPETGRTHQIRVHLASIGHPIVGDSIYGFRKTKTPISEVKRQILHAYSLEFTLSKGKRIKLAANLPDDMKKVLQTLRKANTLH